jgi:hypothetical protein
MNRNKTIRSVSKSIRPLTSALAGLCVILASQGSAQTRERGPWWPSPHGAEDQAGASNYVTPAKILTALRIPATGQTYELGQIYEESMPQYGSRPFYLQVTPPPPPTAEGGVALSEYFTGFIGQMGTQFDALGHQGANLRMADGSLETVFYNGLCSVPTAGAAGSQRSVSSM